MANKVSKAGKSSKSPLPIAGDIPEAVRDNPVTDSQNWWKLVLIACAGLGFGGLGMIAALMVANMPPVVPSNELNASPNLPGVSPTNPDSTSPLPSNSSAPNSPRAANTPDNLLGHYPYSEALASELQTLASDPRIQLRRTTAQNFDAMVQAARSQGVILVPISGFRSVNDQQHLFFDVKAERGQRATQRAEVSAPPGYSEHHTGYAIDVGDGKVPATHLNTDFEKTEAFLWLQQNAARFNFEMSFTLNNPQGVSYEPWHWRFVGDIQSLETFYKTRQGNQSPPRNTSTPANSPSSRP